MILKSLADKKKKMQEDVTKLEAEMEQLRSTHEVSILNRLLDMIIFFFCS